MNSKLIYPRLDKNHCRLNRFSFSQIDNFSIELVEKALQKFALVNNTKSIRNTISIQNSNVFLYNE